jgi:hypothetical protein
MVPMIELTFIQLSNLAVTYAILRCWIEHGQDRPLKRHELTEAKKPGSASISS